MHDLDTRPRIFKPGDGFTIADHLALVELEKEMAEAGLIFGFERGYNQVEDVLTASLDGSDFNAMWREFQRSIAMLNRQRTPLINLFSFQVGNPVESVMLPSEEDFEEASEFGVPKGIRMGKPVAAGYDFKWYDLAIRYTWMFLAESTAAQIRALNSMALEASVRLQFTKILRAVFNNTNRTTTINEQAISVYPLYNADGTVPPKYKGTTFLSTHTHYLASGAATVDPVDLQDMEEHLYHHGYRVINGYKLVLLVNRQEGNTIRTFKNGTDGAKYDFIPSAGYGGGIAIAPNSGIVARPAGDIPGVDVIGTYGPFTIGEEDYVPAGYMFAFASGGENNIGNLVGIREHEQAGLRGLRLVKGADRDYPLTDSYYLQGFGTGVRHRGAGVVMQITAGAYAIPAAYA